MLLLEYCLLHAYALALKSWDGIHRHIDAQTPLCKPTACSSDVTESWCSVPEVQMSKGLFTHKMP